eukprot:350307-Rhodomonas_salina.1
MECTSRASASAPASGPNVLGTGFPTTTSAVLTRWVDDKAHTDVHSGAAVVAEAGPRQAGSAHGLTRSDCARRIRCFCMR